MIKAELDHVAVAVAFRGIARDYIVNELGGGSVASGRRSGMTIDQFRFSLGTKLEVISPDPDHESRSVLESFLLKHGSAIHHVTLLVDSVEDAVDELRTVGIQPAGISLSDPRYQEAFVLPRDAAGVMVQLSWKDVDDEGWARRYGHQPTSPRSNCPDFIGARLSHPSPEDAKVQFERLGGTIEERDGSLVCRWGTGLLEIEIIPGELRATEELKFDGFIDYASCFSDDCKIVRDTRKKTWY